MLFAPLVRWSREVSEQPLHRAPPAFVPRHSSLSLLTLTLRLTVGSLFEHSSRPRSLSQKTKKV